jgi:hypothetical protein
MADTSYRVIPQEGDLFSVEMMLPSGKRRLIPGFRDRSEADAWIIQTAKMLHERDPHHRVTSREAKR